MRKFKTGESAYVSGMFFGLDHEVKVMVLTHDYDIELGWYYDVVMDEAEYMTGNDEVLSLPENRLHKKPRVPRIKTLLERIAEDM